MRPFKTTIVLTSSTVVGNNSLYYRQYDSAGDIAEVYHNQLAEKDRVRAVLYIRDAFFPRSHVPRTDIPFCHVPSDLRIVHHSKNKNPSDQT